MGLIHKETNNCDFSEWAAVCVFIMCHSILVYWYVYECSISHTVSPSQIQPHTSVRAVLLDLRWILLSVPSVRAVGSPWEEIGPGAWPALKSSTTAIPEHSGTGCHHNGGFNSGADS